jgi:hypothetical protein
VSLVKITGKTSAALKICGKTLVQKFPAGGADNFFLAVQFIERVRFEHHTFAVRTVRETKEMPDLMRSFFDNPINKVVIASPAIIILIAQAGRGNHAGTNGFAGKAEDKTVAVTEQVLVDNQKNRFGNSMPVLIGLDTVKQGLCVNLFPDHIQSRDTHMVLRNGGFYTENRFDTPGHRHLEAGRRL